MGMVSFAIADAALEAGATIACGVPVAAVQPGEGVELDDGTLVRAKTVISNADPKRLLGMLDAGIANGAVPGGFRDRPLSIILSIQTGGAALARRDDDRGPAHGRGGQHHECDDLRDGRLQGAAVLDVTGDAADRQE